MKIDNKIQELMIKNIKTVIEGISVITNMNKEFKDFKNKIELQPPLMLTRILLAKKILEKQRISLEKHIWKTGDLKYSEQTIDKAIELSEELLNNIKQVEVVIDRTKEK